MANGFPVADLVRAATLPSRPGDRPARSSPARPAGEAALVLVSAAGSAVLAGQRQRSSTSQRSSRSPLPDTPDVAAVIYAAPPGSSPGSPPRPDPNWWVGPWQDSWTPQDHGEAVTAVRAAIARGDVYQVNLVGHASAPYRGDPGPALARIAALPGARHGNLLTGDGWAVACASPETFLTVRNGRVSTCPIKGTRPATGEGRRALLASTKERAEHVMIVDLCRNDLARVASTGSVRVDQLYQVRRWCDLWQAESTVSADLASGIGLADLLRALAPAGSVTGAPKLAALDLLSTLEPVGRGPSMGALGWITPNRLDLGLTIRTVAVDQDRIHVWAGGGITWGSDPEAEVAEAAAKSAPLRSALIGPTGRRQGAAPARDSELPAAVIPPTRRAPARRPPARA